MTVEANTPNAQYTVAGTGPYAITWPYVAGAIRLFVIESGVLQSVDPASYSVAPLSGASGNLSLTAPAAVAMAGKSIVIQRETEPEQGWQGVAGERETGLERQLDRQVMRQQEIDLAHARSLRVQGSTPLPAIVLAANEVPMWNGSTFVPGPTANEIANAQNDAIAAGEFAEAAEAAAGRVDLGALDAAVLATATDAAAALTARNTSVASAATSEAARDTSVASAAAAAAARDSTFVNGGRVATSIAAGLALSTDGQQFAVIEGDWVQLYTRTNATTAAIITGARYPTRALIDDLSVTIASANLYDATAKRVGFYVSSVNGQVLASASFTCSDFMPVTPGQQITLSASAAIQAGTAFFSSKSDTAVVSFEASSGSGPRTLTVPAGANWLVINTRGLGVPTEPAQIMVNVGAAALPWVAFGDTTYARLSALQPADQTRLTGWDTAKSAVDQTMIATAPNLFNPAAVLDGIYVSTVNGAPSSVAAGWARSALIPVTPGQLLTLSANATMQGGMTFLAANGTTVISFDSANLTAPRVFTVPAGAAFFAFTVKSTNWAQPSQIMLNLGASALPWVAFGAIAYAINPAAISAAGGGRLVFNGTGVSFVESARSGDTLRTDFVAFPVGTLTGYPWLLNLRGEALNGVQVRSAGDDIAPDVAQGNLAGGNHGYYGGTVTATAHGKVNADRGSVWTSGGLQAVLVQVVDANTLILALRASNAVPATGTWTHVSGATNTANIVATAVAAVQLYPVHRNYAIAVRVDGRAITATSGSWNYSDAVEITETMDIMSRTDVVEWWIANGGAGGGNPQAAPSYTMTICYRWDRDGRLTITRDWHIIKAISLNSLWGLQAGAVGTPAQVYVPTAVPFTYNGSPIDPSMGISPTITAASASIDFTAANLRATGLYGDRAAFLWAGSAFFIGFLPVADAAVGVRRTRASDAALQIYQTSGKLYFFALDKGDHTAQPGDHYSVVGYRQLIRRTADRTAAYPVRTTGDDYLFADWHDMQKSDRIPVPDDFVGRQFEVVDSKNVTVAASGVLAGSLPVYVNATTANAWICLRVQR